MDKTSAHSNLIGGSNCRARMACPASWQMEKLLPASAKSESSVYADEGTALHGAIANILFNDLSVESVLGHVYEDLKDHPITQEHIDEALRPCLDFFDNLDDEYGPLEFLVENRVSIPSMDGLFGTCDLIAKGPKENRTILVDWKFGVGEKVEATYMLNGTLTPNPQLMFYALGAYYTRPEMFGENCDIDLWVAQPRHRDGPHFDVAETTLDELMEFERSLALAYDDMQSENPHLEAGDHCRFMACKAVCPKHTGPIFEVPVVIEQQLQHQMRAAVEHERDDVGIWEKNFSLMLELAERIEPVLAEWRTQAQEFLEAGGQIEGYKLVPKRATRKWTKTDAQVERKLARLGLTKDQRMPRALVSAPAAEKILGKGNLPEGYFDAISSGVTIGKASDFRQDVQPVGAVAAALAKALGDLR